MLPSRDGWGARRPSRSAGEPQSLWNQLSIQNRLLATAPGALPFGEGGMQIFFNLLPGEGPDREPSVETEALQAPGARQTRLNIRGARYG